MSRHPFSPENEDVRISGGAEARRCACRGWIVAASKPVEDLPSMVDAVTKHRLSEPHKSWDSEAWRNRNTAKVDVPVIVRKVA